ncbi:MAG: type II toxin-antitoxin system VapB family antitoxin [Alphaproteobacteria bacterium]
MTLHIKDPKADALARQLASLTGETLTEAITSALEARLREVEDAGRRAKRKEEIDEILASFRSLPVLDERTDNEILGYDERGLPG